MRVVQALILMVAATLLAQPARASLETDMLDRWYLLLGQADAAGLGRLMAPKATVALGDLGVTQTRKEFLESMSEWGPAMEGGSIRFKVESTSAGKARAMVCYHFVANELLTRESFEFSSGKITRNVQTKLADDCRGFN